MDDSIIAIIAAISIGIFQLVVSANKKKRAREQVKHLRPDAFVPDFEMEEIGDWEERVNVHHQEEPPEKILILAPKEDIIPRERDMPLEEEESSEKDSILYDFTPQKAILFSEVINQKWNS